MAHSFRMLSLALFLMLLMPSAFALSQNSTAFLEFAAFAIPQGQQFSVQQFPYRGSDCFAVVSGGEIYGLFESGLPVFEDTPITDADEIEKALAAYYASQGNSPNITFADVHAGLLSIMANHEKGEAKCRILTGTDRTECKDFESCQKACYSVTSFCLNIALGSGRDFINEIWEFENDSKLLDAAYGNESKAYSALLDGITLDEAKAYLSAISDLNRVATRASKSALYDGYSYCFEPDYALPVITNMQLTAQKRYAQSEPFLTLSDKAKLVRSRTIAVLEASSEQQRDAEAALAAKQAALQNASAPAPEPPIQSASAIAQQDYGIPLAGAALLGAIFIAGIYLAFFAKKGKKGA